VLHRIHFRLGTAFCRGFTREIFLQLEVLNFSDLDMALLSSSFSLRKVWSSLAAEPSTFLQ
jgi:hypothetical protein